MKVIPGINVKTKKELADRIKQVFGTKKLHLDVMDGRFVKEKTIQSKDINSLGKNQDVQIHYMGYDPLKEFKKYKNISEFIFHVEAEEEVLKIIQEIKKTKVKAGIAFNPETQIKNYVNEIKQADVALVMAVHSGLSGQRMMKEQLQKIARIRKLNKNIQVGVDGGVNQLTIKRVRANFAIATSSIFNAEKPKKALKQLEQSQL